MRKVNILNIILYNARAKDFGDRTAPARLRGAIERYKRQFNHLPWCHFQIPELKRAIAGDVAEGP
jgi:hypothetical protein